MSLIYKNLDLKTRQYMVEEFEMDRIASSIYISDRLNEKGKEKYPDLLKEAIMNGSEASLASSLIEHMNGSERKRKPNGGYTIAKVPHNANETLAEGEFNRYYIRGLCLRLLKEGNGQLRIFRAKQVDNPRTASQLKIGQIVDPDQLLKDLRTNKGVETALGLPAGPNSGLSVEIIPSEGESKSG